MPGNAVATLTFEAVILLAAVLLIAIIIRTELCERRHRREDYPRWRQAYSDPNVQAAQDWAAWTEQVEGRKSA